MISLIKDFNINDSDFLELPIYILKVKSKWFYIKSIFESTLRKPKKAACEVRLNKIRFWKINPGHSKNSELYCTHKINGALPHQEVYRNDKKVKSIFEM